MDPIEFIRQVGQFSALMSAEVTLPFGGEDAYLDLGLTVDGHYTASVVISWGTWEDPRDDEVDLGTFEDPQDAIDELVEWVVEAVKESARRLGEEQALQDEERRREDDDLMACGCREYHYADCPILTG